MSSDSLVWARPEDDDGLALWLQEVLDIEVPREPLIAGHASPFDYLRFAFFEDERKIAGATSGIVLPDDAHSIVADAVPADSPIDCVVWANRGGGKTFLGAVATLLDLVFKPGIEVRILGGSLEQSGRMHAHLTALMARPDLAPLVDGRISLKRLALVNGSSCEILAQSQTAVRGTRVQKLRCDEVELFDPLVWEAAQLVTRSKQCGEVFVRGSVECLSTMHQPYGLMFQLIKEARAGTRTLFKWGVVDVLGVCSDERACEGDNAPACPLLDACGGRAKQRDALGSTAGHISVGDAIDLKRRSSNQAWETEMLCLRPSRSDCVLPEFDQRVHAVTDLPPSREGWLWVAGMDFGFRAPTVILAAGLDLQGVLWIVDESVRAGCVLDEHIAWLRKPPTARVPKWIGVDPAGRQRSDQTGLSNVQVMRRAGLKVHDRSMGIEAGLSLVRTRLRPASGDATLMIHQRCAKLIESLERYHYPADQPESMVPVKDGFDHAVDALRYLIQNLDNPVRTVYSKYT